MPLIQALGRQRQAKIFVGPRPVWSVEWVPVHSGLCREVLSQTNKQINEYEFEIYLLASSALIHVVLNNNKNQMHKAMPNKLIITF